MKKSPWKIFKISGLLPVVYIGLLFCADPVFGQVFGRNKALYKSFDFKVHETPHFEIYEYFNNDSLLHGLANASEKWYLMHQEIFKDTFDTRNPLIFYATHADFQQTRTISGSIGQGTGGVTEAFKNRVVMPVTESNAQTDHVLGHELVHAYQYNMFKNNDSLSLRNISNIPLWMVEGMAEYLSIGSVDAHTAMWMRDAVQNEDIPSIQDLTRNPRYFPYRYGQAFWAFVGGVWGDSVIHPLFLETAKVGTEQAIKNILGVDAKTLSGMWKTNLQEHYAPFKENRSTRQFGEAIITDKNAGTMNISPAISPDGRYVVFLSEKNVFTYDLYLADAKTGKIIKQLTSVAREGHIDAFSFLESAGTWNPYSNQFAFVIQAKGKNKLAIVDVAEKGGLFSRTKLREIPVPGVEAFSNPSWSPDGDRIAFTGMVRGQPDLFVFDLTTQNLTRLTHDGFSELQPSWSPDGEALIFATDRQGTKPFKRQKKGYQLASMDLNSREVTLFPVFPGAENLNPVYSPDGNHILFLSNRDGFRDLYKYNLNSGNVYQLTRYFTGISGITQNSPALSVAREVNEVVYSYYNKNTYTIYRANFNDFPTEKVNREEVNFEAAVLPGYGKSENDIVNANLNNEEKYLVDLSDEEITTHPYEPKFKLDYIGNTGTSIGVSTGGAYGTSTGLSGAVSMLFSDILGNNQLFAGVALNGEIYDLGGQFVYFNQKNRINWGASVSHIPYSYGSLSLTRETVKIGGENYEVNNWALTQTRIFEEKVGVFAFYPLSTTERFEVSGSQSWYHYRIDKLNNYYDPVFGYSVGGDREKLDAPDGFNLKNITGAYVGDNSYFGIASPMLGYRYRIQDGQYLGAYNLNEVYLDYRHYFWMKPWSFAIRGLHMARYGADANRIYPLSIAYPWMTRGNDFGSYNNDRYQTAESSNFTLGQMFGSKILVANMELRLPFTGPEKLAVIKSGILFTELAWFFDAGVAYENGDQLGFTWEPELINETGSAIYTRVPVYTTGLSLRLNLFGQLIIEPYYAIPLQKATGREASFGVNFTPGW